MLQRTARTAFYAVSRSLLLARSGLLALLAGEGELLSAWGAGQRPSLESKRRGSGPGVSRAGTPGEMREINIICTAITPIGGPAPFLIAKLMKCTRGDLAGSSAASPVRQRRVASSVEQQQSRVQFTDGDMAIWRYHHHHSAHDTF